MMKLLFFFFLLLFVLSFSTAKATEQGAWNKMYFLSMVGCEYLDSQTVCLAYGCQWYSGSCHSPSLTNATLTICHEILKVGDYKLCLTTDNKLVLVTSSVGAIGLIYIPLKRRREYE